MDPGWPKGHIAAWAEAVVLGKKAGVTGHGLAPVMPAFGENVLIHIAVDENRLCIFPPWPAKIGGAGRAAACEAAAFHHIAIGLALGGGGGGHIAVDAFPDIFGEKFAVLKIGLPLCLAI